MDHVGKRAMTEEGIPGLGSQGSYTIQLPEHFRFHFELLLFTTQQCLMQAEFGQNRIANPHVSDSDSKLALMIPERAEGASPK